MRVTLLVGNPKAGSRTREVGETVGQWLCAERGAEMDRVIELADYAPVLFDWADQNVAELNAHVANSDVLIVATPTYKATYTGLLKSFLDRYDAGALAGVTAIPVVTGGSMRHAMGADHGLRPLLVELGASVPTQSLYLTMDTFDDRQAVVGAWAESNLRSRGHFGPVALD